VKRNWNWSLWVGFLIVLIGILSYIPFFAQFPVTRDFPWATLLLFVVGTVLLVRGMARAYREPQVYRGKIAGPILSGLSFLAIALFCYGIFFMMRQLPASTAAPHVGQKAPDFTLPDQNGKPVALAELLSPAGNSNGVLLIFYRGHW
jgi:hypothetical protein